MRVRIDGERPAPRKLEPAVSALATGKVIVYPTDTGYAFGCALSSAKGIATIRRLKGFGERHPKPLTMLVAGLGDFSRYGYVDNQAFRLLRRILPGPYTIVLRASSEVPRAMHNRNHEVGLRMSAHPTCALLVEALGEPLLTGSLTNSDDPPELEEPENYETRYRGEVAVVVDAGPLWPEPSTVLRLGDATLEVLREGQGPLPEWA